MLTRTFGDCSIEPRDSLRRNAEDTLLLDGVESKWYAPVCIPAMSDLWVTSGEAVVAIFVTKDRVGVALWTWLGGGWKSLRGPTLLDEEPDECSVCACEDSLVPSPSVSRCCDSLFLCDGMLSKKWRKLWRGGNQAEDYATSKLLESWVEAFTCSRNWFPFTTGGAISSRNPRCRTLHLRCLLAEAFTTIPETPEPSQVLWTNDLLDLPDGSVDFQQSEAPEGSIPYEELFRPVCGNCRNLNLSPLCQCCVKGAT